jgi:hypothetical protein
VLFDETLDRLSLELFEPFPRRLLSQASKEQIKLTLLIGDGLFRQLSLRAENREVSTE